MKSSEMLDLDRIMPPADQWKVEDLAHPVPHGAVTMRHLWRPLTKLVAACERRAVATCLEDKMIGPYHFTGCGNGKHAPGCAVHKAEADVTSALAAVHATGNHPRKVPQEENLQRSIRLAP